MIRSIWLRFIRYNASISRNPRFGETMIRPYSIDLRLYQVLDILPNHFIQISQSIVNIDAISHLKLAQWSG